MLLNYPQENIDDLCEIIHELVPKNNESHKILKKSSLSSLNNKLVKNQSLKPLPSMVKESDLFRSNISLVMSDLFNKKKGILIPTNFNNKIKLLTMIIYKKYAGGNSKMSFAGFNEWIRNHIAFLESFDSCFRTDLWKSKKVNNQDILAFETKTPDLQGYHLIQNLESFLKKRYFIRIYDFFLVLFKNKNSTEPIRVIILKGLNIYFNEFKYKIIISNPNNNYKGLKIILPDLDHFATWKYFISENCKDVFFNKYNIVEKIGRGKFSIIYKVSSKKDLKSYAMKIIQKENLSPTEISVLEKEAKIMAVLNHRNIVKFYEATENFNSYSYILELIEGIDLFQYVVDQKSLKEEQILPIMKDLINAVEYLHDSGIVHRDLKPENIMLQFDKKNKIVNLKIIDFGLSCYFDDLKDFENLIRCGTLNYSAPELIDLEKPYDYKIDVYSLGVIMYFMFKGTVPFCEGTSSIIKFNVINKELDLLQNLQDINISEDAMDLLSQLLIKTPLQRISLKKARSHHWFLKSSLLKPSDDLLV